MGFGLGYLFNFKHDADFQHERLSVAYRFVNLGSVSLGTRGPQYPYALYLGKVTSETIYLNITHIF